MATNYARGAALERRAKADLMTRGAFVVRAAGSHGAVDLCVHWLRARPWFVQCKRDGKLTAGEAAKLRALSRLYRAQPVLCRPGPGGRGLEYERL